MMVQPSLQQSIPMSSAEIDETDIQAVLSVLHTGRLALGPKIRAFEQAMRDYVGVKHAIAVNSGTAALHLIARSLGIGPGDEVLVPSFTFAASVNAFLYEGAIPVFVDIEPETYNLDPEDLARKITPRTRAIMVVDVFGHPADWDRILNLAEKQGLAVIDDCCEAVGAEYRGVKLGRLGDAGAFAFYPNKQLTTGEGGIVVTDRDDVAALCRSLSNQGRGEMGAWLEHEHLGYNYRLDEMSAALGESQLRRLDTFLAKRACVAQRYTERLSGLPWVRTPVVRPEVKMSWFVYVVTLAEGLNRDPIMRAMEAQGVPARGYFSPIHLQPYILKRFQTATLDLPVTESIARRTIALPFHNNLSEVEIERVVSALETAIAQAA
jgi:perosamine synthetase